MNEHEITGALTFAKGRAFTIPNGWPLNSGVEVDDACPGFLARVCRARLIWRQSLWAALAAGMSTNAEMMFRATGDESLLDAEQKTLMAAFGQVATSLTARELSEISYGSCPEGWLGALRKLHGQTFPSPETYRLLFELYSSDLPLDAKRREVLGQCSMLDEHRLGAVLAMNDPALICTTILARLSGPDEVRKFEENIAQVRRYCTWAGNDAVLREAIIKAMEKQGHRWLISLMERADKLIPETHPCDASPDLERFPVCKAGEIGREYRNCLEPRRILPQAVSGVWTMVLWREEGLLIEMRMLDSGTWQVRRIHAVGNADVTREVALRVRDKMAPLGVSCLIAADPPPHLAGLGTGFDGWNRHLFAAFDFWD